MCYRSKLFIILLCVKYSSCEFTAYILGGERLKIKEAPYSAQFYNAGGFCGSSVLTSWALLTAAHCFEYNSDVDLMLARVGAEQYNEHKSDVHRVIKVTIHKKYNKGVTFSHDIALVFLQTHLKLRSTVQRALVAPTSEFLSDYTPKAFRVSGWGWTSWPKGQTSQQGLMGVNMTLVGIHRCSKLHNTTLSHDMFCLYGGYHRDSCKGDSGGGIMWKTYLVGIVSHGEGCGLKNKPGVYANVFHFRHWIFENLILFRDKYCTHTRTTKLKRFLRLQNGSIGDRKDDDGKDVLS